MAARDFYRDAAAMGGRRTAHVRAYGGVYRLLNVVNPALEVINRGKHPRPGRRVCRCAQARARSAQLLFGR